MWKDVRNQKRDKSAPAKAATDKTPKATQEQMMIAKLVDNDNEDTQLRKNVSKIVEVTGVNEEKALLALYDSNDDPSRAIELLLERQSAGEDNGWETAGRRKNRGANSVTRNAEQTTNTDTKAESGDKIRSDRGGGTNRGRRSKGRTFDQNKSQDDSNNKENEHVYSARDKRPGRGRSRPGMGRGRGRGSAPRHNRHRQPGVKSDGGSMFQSDSTDAFQEPVEVWENPKPTVKCWDIEVGTWSSKEAQKHQDTNAKSEKDVYQTNWGTESWNEPDLSESRVFQSQNQITVKPEVASENSIPTTAEAYSGHEHMPNSLPKTGERIDLGLLFKKMDTGIRNPGMQSSSSNYSGLVNMTQGKADRNETDSSDGVPGIQQHCQVTYKDSSISSNSVTSRLFGDYEQSQSKSIFQSEQSPNMMKSAFPQLNGSATLHGQAKESNSFLDSFSGLHSSTSTKSSQPDLLGQLSNLASVQSQLPSYSQMRMPIGKNHTSHADTTAMDNFTKGRNENLLSFGSPLPPQLSQQTRQQRKATLPPKMPASAVEMPLNKGSHQDYSQFSLQFGSDDPSSMSELAKHEYDVNIPRSTSSNIIAQRSGIFLNKDGSQKSNAPGHVDSLFSSSMQTPSNTELQPDELQNAVGVATVDHSIKVPPGLNMSVTTSSSYMPLSSSDNQNNVGGNFLSRNLANDDGSGQLQDSGHHGPTSFSHEVSPYYATTTSNQSPNSRPGQPSMSPVTQTQAHNQDNLNAANMETSSLTTAMGQVSMSQPTRNDGPVPRSGASPLSYTSTVSTSESQLPPGTSSASINRKPVYSTVHDKTASGSYDNSTSGPVSNNLAQEISPMALKMQQPQNMHPSGEPVNNQSNMVYKAQAASSPNALGGFGSAKMAPVVSNKGNPNVPSGVTTPIQYGIHMPGLMPYPPEMQYGYDQLLLAQSRVVNPLVSNFYDVPFHGNTQTADGQDSSVPVAQNMGGHSHSKFNRNDGSSSTPSAQMAMPGAASTDPTQHSSSVPMQAIHKVTQSSTHLPGQQPYVGMPAYPNYGNLAAPYYSLGMANAGFQYPATMFAAAMHQAPKHAASSTDSFPQSSTRFNHNSTSMTSSSGLSELSRNSFQKTHPSGLDKQGYHQHTNTPPSFNLQTITAAVAGGTANGNTAPGLGPYAAPPYMTLLQPHHASQQQAMHMLQHQHQDPSSGHSAGSQRNLGNNGMVKSNKRGGYGTSSYWTN